MYNQIKEIINLNKWELCLGKQIYFNINRLTREYNYGSADPNTDLKRFVDGAYLLKLWGVEFVIKSRAGIYSRTDSYTDSEKINWYRGVITAKTIKFFSIQNKCTNCDRRLECLVQ